MLRKSSWILVVMLMGLPGAFAQSGHFDISATEPLQQGDTITVLNSETFTTLHNLVGAWAKFYYNGFGYTDEHQIPGTMVNLSLNAQYEIEGTVDLDIGAYTWATEVQIDVGMVYLGQLRHFYSRNRLDVTPTTLYVPAASTWGLIVMLGVFAILLIRCRH